MAINSWWSTDPSERFWMEVTDREDLGASLHAPQTNEYDKPYWGYSLVKETRLGDVVLHYESSRSAITGFSIVTGAVCDRELTWNARGTTSRNKAPHLRSGWWAECGGFERLPIPLPLPRLREEQEALAQLKADLEGKHGSPVYFPFQFQRGKGIRATQGYLLKVPASLIGMFDELAPVTLAAGTPEDFEPTENEVELAKRVGRLQRTQPPTPPPGNLVPPTVETAAGKKYARLATIIVHVLRRSAGKCELCEKRPFLRDNGSPFLEVHHVKQLARFGSDRVSNAVALCPDCHRELHHGAERKARVRALYDRISELVEE